MLLQLFSLALLLAAAYFIFTQYKNSKETPQNQNTEMATNTTVNETNTYNQTNPPAAVSVTKTTVETPKTETMPQEVTKRTQTTKHEQPFQLKVTQRESLYNMLVEYKDNKSYTTAIKIAQFYLAQKDYEKAVKWAVEASKKDPSQAQSWIIYAKAKKALGKPDVAKRALTIFLKHNYSQPAQNLLDSL